MRINPHFIVILALLFSIKTFSQTISAPSWTKKVGARSFPNSQKIYYANNFGANNDPVKINTNFIQNAIDVCASNGGGIVAFRPGTYVTGAIFLKNNVNLRIDKDVVILGSQNFDDYPGYGYADCRN